MSTHLTDSTIDHDLVAHPDFDTLVRMSLDEPVGGADDVDRMVARIASETIVLERELPLQLASARR